MVVGLTTTDQRGHIPDFIFTSQAMPFHHASNLPRKNAVHWLGVQATDLDLCEPLQSSLVVKETEPPRLGEDVAVLRERTSSTTHHGNKVVLLQLTKEHRPTRQNRFDCFLQRKEKHAYIGYIAGARTQYYATMQYSSQHNIIGPIPPSGTYSLLMQDWGGAKSFDVVTSSSQTMR